MQIKFLDQFFFFTESNAWLPIYASSIPELTTVQNFLQRCFKRKYIPYQIDIYDVLQEVDRSLFKKISSIPGQPLYPSLTKTKLSSEFLAVNFLGLIHSVFLVDYFSNIEQLFYNVIWILNVKFNASTWNGLVILFAVFNVKVFLVFSMYFCLRHNKDLYCYNY